MSILSSCPGPLARLDNLLHGEKAALPRRANSALGPVSAHHRFARSRRFSKGFRSAQESIWGQSSFVSSDTLISPNETDSPSKASFTAGGSLALSAKPSRPNAHILKQIHQGIILPSHTPETYLIIFAGP